MVMIKIYVSGAPLNCTLAWRGRQKHGGIYISVVSLLHVIHFLKDKAVILNFFLSRSLED